MKRWQVGLMGLAAGLGFTLLFGGIVYVAMRDAKPSDALIQELRKPTKADIEKAKKGVVYAIPPAEQQKRQ